MQRGERIELRGFGVFQVKPRKRGIGRNPRTGKEVRIPPGRTIRFKPGKDLQNIGMPTALFVAPGNSRRQPADWRRCDRHTSPRTGRFQDRDGWRHVLLLLLTLLDDVPRALCITRFLIDFWDSRRCRTSSVFAPRPMVQPDDSSAILGATKWGTTRRAATTTSTPRCPLSPGAARHHRYAGRRSSASGEPIPTKRRCSISASPARSRVRRARARAVHAAWRCRT